jgi:L-fucose isomerase-like protein
MVPALKCRAIITASLRDARRNGGAFSSLTARAGGLPKGVDSKTLSLKKEYGLTAPCVGFITCVHPIYNLPSVVQHRDHAISGLRAAGCDVIAPGIARDPQDVPQIVDALKKGNIDLLLFFFCTWVAEEITLSIARELEDVPLLLWALPYLDLLIPMPSPMTGITATGCNLRRTGRSYLHRIGGVTPERIQTVARTARNATAVKRLRQAKFGIIGFPCPGMIDTSCDNSLLEKKLGFTAIHCDIESLLRAREASSAQEALQLALQLRERVGRNEVELETIADQYRLHLGMKALIQEHQLDGFSVRCWPELRDKYKATICLAMAEMAESGVASACEADLTALVTSYILTSLAGQPSCTLEITAYLEEQNALQMAHCGSAAMSLAENLSCAVVRGHMRTGAGALIEFALKPGRVTIAKLLRPCDGSFKLFVGRGEIIPTDPAIRGTVATIRVEPSPARFLQAMLQHAVEHHLVIVYGDWTEDLTQFAQFAGIEIIFSDARQAIY